MAEQSDKPKNRSEFITPEEVAQILRINVLTVYRYIRKGSLGAIRIGRGYRIGRGDLDTFIESNRVEE